MIEPETLNAGDSTNLYGARDRLLYYLPSIIFLLCFILLYGRCIFFEYMNWDDQVYILDNPFLKEFSLSNIQAICSFGKVPDEDLYIPVTYLSLLPNGALFNFNPMIAHGVNVLLHAMNTLMVYRLVKRFLGKSSWSMLAAAIFCFHPIQVESVAWVFGRKDLLACFFIMLAFELFVRFVEHSSIGYYLASLLCFQLSLLSKPTTLLLPISLLFVPHLIGHPFRRKNLIQIVPFLALGVVAYAINRPGAEVAAGKEMPNILVQLGYLPYILTEFILRLFNISRCTAFYLWRDISPDVISIASLVIPAALSIACYYGLRKKAAGAMFPLSIALLSFAPAVSMILFKTRIFYTADRYFYVGMIGFSFLVAYICGEVSKKFQRPQAILVIALAFVATCAVRTHHQTGRWRSPVDFGVEAVAENRRNPIAWSILGAYFRDKERYSKADDCFREGIQCELRYKPNWDGYYENAKYTHHPRLDQIGRHYHIAANPWQFSSFLSAGRLYVEGKKEYAFWLIKTRFPDKQTISDASLLNLYEAMEVKLGESAGHPSIIPRPEE